MNETQFQHLHGHFHEFGAQTQAVCLAMRILTMGEGDDPKDIPVKDVQKLSGIDDDGMNHAIAYLTAREFFKIVFRLGDAYFHCTFIPF